ncbi:hypothetical protein ACFX58_05410 [Sphingomonas sp. NCPPB 2930]
MTHLPTIHARAARAAAAALTLTLVLAAGAGAQGTTTSGTASPHGAAEAPVHQNRGAGTNAVAGGKHDAAAKRAGSPKRDGDLGRAPFGTGSRRHDASAAGAPSAKPKGDADGAAGTR